MADTATETITIPVPVAEQGPVGPQGPAGPAGVAPADLAWLEARISAIEAWVFMPIQHIPVKTE